MWRDSAELRCELNRCGDEEAAPNANWKAHDGRQAPQAAGSRSQERGRSGAQRLDELTARRSAAARSASVSLTSSGVMQKHAVRQVSTKSADAKRAKQGVWFPMRPNV